MNKQNFSKKLMQNKYLASIFTPETQKQLKRYLIVGFSSAGLEFFLLYLFKDQFKLSLIAANSFALSIIFWFNFLLNRLWSFSSKGNLKRQLILYGLLFIFNLAASDFIMYSLTTLLGFNYLLAKVFAIGVIVIWNFTIYKKIIYR